MCIGMVVVIVVVIVCMVVVLNVVVVGDDGVVLLLMLLLYLSIGMKICDVMIMIKVKVELVGMSGLLVGDIYVKMWYGIVMFIGSVFDE